MMEVTRDSWSLKFHAKLMVLHRQLLFRLIIEAILMRNSAEQVSSLHRVAPRYFFLLFLFKQMFRRGDVRLPERARRPCYRAYPHLILDLTSTLVYFLPAPYSRTYFHANPDLTSTLLQILLPPQSRPYFYLVSHLTCTLF